MAVFPEEILELIFSYLEPIRIPTPDGSRFECDDHMQRKTLASICRANKACNRIAYPYLYRTIHLSGFSSRPRLLLRSLLHNSKLTPEVRVLRISGRAAWNRNPQKDLGRHFESTSNENLRLLAYPIVKSLHLSTGMRNHILAGVQSKLEDCEIACIAAICPYLEVLDLPAFRDLCHTALMRVITEMYGTTSDYQVANSQSARKSNGPAADQFYVDRVDVTPCSFFQIRDISLNRGFDQDEMAIGEVLPLLYLPKLETFQANNIKISYWIPLSTMPLGSSCVRVLSITDILFEGYNLALLFRGCSNLHTLSIRADFKPPYSQHSFSGMGRAMNQFGGNLRVITLGTSTYRSISIRDPLGDIRNLRFLRVLNIAAVALFGQRLLIFDGDIQYVIDSVVDLLPTSLERLSILTHMGTKQTPDFSPAIMELWMDNRFTNLQQVSFDRLAWTEKLLQMAIWDSSDSTPTRVVLKRSV